MWSLTCSVALSDLGEGQTSALKLWGFVHCMIMKHRPCPGPDQGPSCCGCSYLVIANDMICHLSCLVSGNVGSSLDLIMNWSPSLLLYNYDMVVR